MVVGIAVLSVVTGILVIGFVAVKRKRHTDSQDSSLVANFSKEENGTEASVDVTKTSYAEAITEDNNYYEAGSLNDGEHYAINTVDTNEYYE